MEREQIDSMLARISEIRNEVGDWEAGVRPLLGGKEVCEAISIGLIELKWCLEAALQPEDEEAAESQ